MIALLITVIYALLLASLCMLTLIYQTIRRQQNSSAGVYVAIAELQKEIKIMSSGNIGLGKSLMSIGNKVNFIIENQRSEPKNTYDSQVYEHAKKITKMGANTDELAKTCGITKAEAELIIAMESTKGTAVYVKDNQHSHQVTRKVNYG